MAVALRASEENFGRGGEMAQKKKAEKGKKEAKAKRKKKEAKAEAEAAEKKGLPVKWIVIGLVPLILGGGGFFAWQKFLKGKAEEKKVEVAKKEEEKKKVPMSYLSLEPFVVNLRGGGKRFLKVAITLGLEGEKTAEQLKGRIPPIRNAILMLLTNKTFEEVSSVGGKKKLQEEIIACVNGIVEGEKVKEVYFTDFIAQ